MYTNMEQKSSHQDKAIFHGRRIITLSTLNERRIRETFLSKDKLPIFKFAETAMKATYKKLNFSKKVT